MAKAYLLVKLLPDAVIKNVVKDIRNLDLESHLIKKVETTDEKDVHGKIVLTVNYNVDEPAIHDLANPIFNVQGVDSVQIIKLKSRKVNK